MKLLRTAIKWTAANALCLWAFLCNGTLVLPRIIEMDWAPASQERGLHPNPVRVQGVVDDHRVVQGKPFVLHLHVTVEKGYHINSNRPRDKFLIPTQVIVKNTPEFTFMPAKFPPALDRKLEFSEEKVLVFEGEVQFEVPARSNGNASPGQKNISGSLRYQACDENTCYPPKTIPFDVPVEVVK
ncbi:MAG: protein-disulfide reductase DsbD N-terminal domain-containing protein [Acidobacteriia bacterium]|nr:protein-disulfide reductase DsbD N-terminal domain-containing protein [Terriglobia bacterium]